MTSHGLAWRGFVHSLMVAGVLLLPACKQQTASPPVLHVGDQLLTLQTVLKAAGEDQPGHYRIEWANFLGGPAVTAAETGGSVDIGWMNETPLVFAQEAGSPIKVVAVGHLARPGAGTLALVVPSGSPIRHIADLKGKKVSFAPGTSAQFLVAAVLANNGLSLKDIVPIKGNSFTLVNLENGTVDAIVTAEPWLTGWLNQGKIRVLARGGPPDTSGFLDYLVAPDTALANPAQSALIGDFVVRVARAYRWAGQHPDKVAPFYARELRVSVPLARQILTRSQHRFDPIDATIIRQQQQEADLFLAQGQIATRVNAADLFDHRYDRLIAPVEAAK